MKVVFKLLKYGLYLILSLVGLILILIYFPNGSIEGLLKKRNVPALGYAIIEIGVITESKVFGELEDGIPAPQDAIFNVASVTKPVFATMVMNLVEDGLIGLDDPVYHHWVDPDIQSDDRHKLLTPRLLLSHQSGFPNWRWFNEDGKLSFWHEPGTTYHYSGEGMEYLKKTIENKSGISLIPLIDSIIFNPVGMVDTKMIWDSILHESRLAKFHNSEGGLYEIHKRTNPVASDDLCTTTSDLAKFALFVLNENGGLTDATFEEMVTINSDVNGRSGYGMGWQVVPDLPNGEYALVHGGSDQGVRARMVILPKSKCAFIAFVNGDNGQQVIDRLMVDKLMHGDDVLSKIYAPVIWRIIHLPFKVF